MDPDKWDYVVSFWAVSHGCILAFERSGDGFGEGTADRIRLIWSASPSLPLIASIRVHLHCTFDKVIS